MSGPGPAAAIEIPAYPRWRVFPPLALGTVMATLDISVVGLVLPVLARDLGAPLSLLSWVVLAYVLAITGLLLGFGRLADRVGRRRVYGVGLLVFAASSALCAASPAAGWLIAARALQGIGAAMMSANSTALLVAAFPREERGRALGAFGASVGAGLAFGPPLGGWVVAALSWHWIFLINVPIGAIAFALLMKRVPNDAPAPGAAPVAGPGGAAAPGPLAAALWPAGLILVMLAVSLSPARGWSDRGVLAAALGGVSALALFAWVESRSSFPLMPWDLLGGALGRTLLLTLVGQALSMGVAILLPLQLEEVTGFDPGHAGRWLAVAPVAALLCAPLAGRWADRFGTRPLAVAGLLIAAAGAFLLSGLGVTNHGLFAGAALFGFGLGLFTVPNASAVMGAVPAHLLGSASGLQATARNLGIAGGTAAASVAVATLYARLAHTPLLGGHIPSPQHAPALARAIGAAFLGAAGLAVAGAAFALLVPGAPGVPGAQRTARPGK